MAAAVIAGIFVTAFVAYSVVIRVAFAPALVRCRRHLLRRHHQGLASAKSVSRSGIARSPFVPSVVSVISQPGVERRRAR
jgi:hypothetical protein